MKAIIFMRVIFKKFAFLLCANIILLFLASLIDAVSVFSLVAVVDLFINPGQEAASLITRQITAMLGQIGLPVTLGSILVIFVSLNLLRAGFQVFAQNSILRTKYAVLRDIMLGTFEDFFNARWNFFSSARQGILLNTFIREINFIGDAFGAMARYFAVILQVALYLVVPFYLSWQVTTVSLITAFIFAIPFFLLGRVSYRLGKLNTSTANQIGSVIQENLSLAKLVLGFAGQRKSVDSLAGAFDSHRNVTVKSQTLSYAIPLLYYPLGLSVLIIGLFSARRLMLPLSETVVLFYALAKIIPCIGTITEQKAYLDNFFPSYEQVVNLRERAKELKQPTGSRIFTGFNQIRIEGLSFAYPDQGPVFNNLDMKIEKGKMVAIVGESGIGKSTLIDMLMGFNEPSSGRISFDGVPLAEFDINSYRRHIGYVPQDSVLFNATVRDNLLWANENASEKEIVEACRQANALEFIESLPKGYDTFVGDRGVRLSGGQIQRIALARAILRKPQLLILDEATSALDTYSERLIQQAIEGIVRETTVIVVAHRLSTIINADYIYLIKDWGIAEEGTYAQLMQKNSHFTKLARLQALEVS